MTRSRSRRDREAKAVVRQLSLRDVYARACAEQHVHVNSGVHKMLPGKPDAAAPLTVLDVSDNYLGDRGVAALMSVVDKLPLLRRLVLSHNGLRNRGVECVCRAATDHPTLTSIDLSDNYISEGAAVAVAALLRENARIVDVVMDNTAIDVVWRVRLHDLMAANRHAASRDAAAQMTHSTPACVAVEQ